ncbi:alpha/beta fold hydrolase [Gramella sp. GC03-9]|uniref:Alpha/beta fold hydrolase n=1 Tax=Christiangramia oceanisediminis TaxID=2920386 RepID=A0A9X2I360_9FLAO|nr:alpha/beta fold hydrolase [Gramella oceanisediminis]MCP9199850.1 alpha/beta fold hydrolase [Gramella oceanisediminis]
MAFLVEEILGILGRIVMAKNVAIVIEEHEASGYYLDIEGVKTFVMDQGSGEAVLCVHGVPTSSFLYRKVVLDLAEKGFRGICIDLPGLGLSDRPENFDYRFSNFALFLEKTLERLKISNFHLVVHDIGGPIGFALAANNLENVQSLTILNTMVDIANFTKPFVMRPFEFPVLGELELKCITHLTWPVMFGLMGVVNSEGISSEEIKAYVDLLKRQDNGKAFLKIMRNFEQSEAFQQLCDKTLKNVDYPMQAIWGEKDPALDIKRYGDAVLKHTDVKKIHGLNSKHLLQEEVPQEIADLIIVQARSIRPE